MEEWENSQIKVTGVAHPPISWCKLQFLVPLSLGRKAKYSHPYRYHLRQFVKNIQLFRERLSEKVHATIPKGIVGGFKFTVLQRNLKKWQERPWTYV